MYLSIKIDVLALRVCCTRALNLSRTANDIAKKTKHKQKKPEATCPIRFRTTKIPSFTDLRDQ